MDSDSVLAQSLKISEEFIYKNGKESWYTGLSFIFDQLNIDDDMSVYEIKSVLIKRSMDYWENR